MQVNCADYHDSYDVRSEDDIKRTADLAFEIWHEYWRDKLSFEQIVYMLKEFQSFDAIKKQIENENHIYKILRCNGEDMGYFCVYKVLDKSNYLFLSKLYIKKDYRGMGVGKRAFEEIKSIAKTLSLNSIRLHVNKYNTNAIKAYEKWGFSIVDAFVKDVGHNFVMDDYAMEYELQKQSF